MIAPNYPVCEFLGTRIRRSIETHEAIVSAVSPEFDFDSIPDPSSVTVEPDPMFTDPMQLAEFYQDKVDSRALSIALKSSNTSDPVGPETGPARDAADASPTSSGGSASDSGVSD